jgi:hypothetical protein
MVSIDAVSTEITMPAAIARTPAHEAIPAALRHATRREFNQPPFCGFNSPPRIFSSLRFPLMQPFRFVRLPPSCVNTEYR